MFLVSRRMTPNVFIYTTHTSSTFMKPDLQSLVVALKVAARLMFSNVKLPLWTELPGQRGCLIYGLLLSRVVSCP